MIVIDNKASEIEVKIIEVANKVFLKKGIQGTTMGQIADEAGISRTSLNYYFRSKKHLVIHVVNGLENKIVPAVSSLINNEELTILEKIQLFVDEYLSLISKYPMIPNFIFSELSQDPEWFFQALRQRDLDFEKFIIQMDKEISKGQINSFTMEELFVNVFGLCAFPVLIKPILMEFFFQNNKEEIDKFMDLRKNQVKRLINCWLEK
jgi:AcrR family transcriptional regulator